MKNQEIFITVLIVALVLMKYFNYVEGFESNNFELNNYPCTSHPNNSNCTCPTDSPSQRVIGKFPMNYGQTSPYLYSCVSNSVPEPNTNVFPNPPE